MAKATPVFMTPESRRVLRDTVIAIRNIRGAGGIDARYVPGSGITIALLKKNDPPAAGSVTQRFRVQSEQTNHLVCRTLDLDDNIGSVDINVAKPPDLRGHIATRTVGSEVQDITPPYAAGSNIFCVVPAGGTGVPDASWQDMNADARYWGKECVTS